MKLLLDDMDLKEEHRMVNCSLTRFEHFTEEAQEAIRVVGKATYETWERDNYNAIYPPKEPK